LDALGVIVALIGEVAQFGEDFGALDSIGC
jgi:hypothetical protein